MDSLANSIADTVNAVREKKALINLLPADDKTTLQHVGFKRTHFEVTLNADEDIDASAGQLLAAVEAALNNDDALDPAAVILIDAAATHLDAEIILLTDEQKLHCTLSVYYHLLELDPLGPMIDGDLVLQGSSIHETFAPAFAVVQYTADDSTDATAVEISVISPWTMILSPPEVDTDAAAGAAVAHKAARFIIPISVEEQYRAGGKLRVLVYVEDVSNIPYEEEVAAYDMSSAERRAELPCAVMLEALSANTSSIAAAEVTDDADEAALNSEEEAVDADVAGEDDADAENEDAADVIAVPDDDVAAEEDAAEAAADAERAEEQEQQQQQQPVELIKDIKIAADYDDVVALQSEGYELVCSHITAAGVAESDNAHLWPFHVLASYLSPHENVVGLEDIQWVKCLKSLGTLPEVPLFEIMHDFDLSSADDDFSIYLAFKRGPNARFQQLVMLSTDIDNDDGLNRYVSSFHGTFRPASNEVVKTVGGPCGLLMLVDKQPHSDPFARPKTAAEEEIAAAAQSASTAFSEGERTPNGRASKVSGDGAEGSALLSGTRSPAEFAGDNSNDLLNAQSDEESEEEQDDEEEIMASLMDQLDDLDNEKTTLQTLNAELQKRAVLLMNREKAIQGQAAARTASEAADASDNMADQNQEKEKQYQDTLLLVVDERNKLSKQLKEFDQLALDLQTRLDDKELKANGISSSFKLFKKEILSKAENSRTGHGISKAQIKQFEAAEQKHEEDLERVRLRNISLRTTYRKLERTLRAREQLAEGLHMIDFEQLKIENQTLNEKIEERNEELSKLKRKKTTTVQVLTHVREKLRFVERANETQAAKLARLEAQITTLRNGVTVDKLNRDTLRSENKDLRTKQGFATSDLLLVDYEHRCNKVEELKAATGELKERYSMLVNQVNKNNMSMGSAPWMLSETM